MSGERDLNQLLATMSPVLIDREFVFVTFENARYGDHSELQPFAAVDEPEGLTLLVPKSCADEQQLSYDSIFKGITLRVHSSLGAVGLTAAFAAQLATHSISANVLAGYFHDHIFVQSSEANNALVALESLAEKHRT
jgi:hypothetical protein